MHASNKALILATALMVAAPLAQARAASDHVEPRQPEIAEAAADLSAEGFVEIASTYALFHMRSGQWAQDKAQDPKVRAFAAAVTKYHDQAYNHLTKLHPDGIKLRLDDLHRDVLEQIKGTADQNFDTKYVAEEIAMLRKAIDLYKGYAEAGGDAELKSYAQAQLPTLEDYLQKAEALNDA